MIKRYVKTLRAQKLSSATLNQKFSAIRKFASEAEDNNLIDSRIVNGIRAGKGVPLRGGRTGNWLTKEDAQFEKYEGEYSGYGPKKRYSEKFNYAQLPKKYLKNSDRDGKIIKNYYQGIFLSKSFAGELNILIIEKST